MLFVVEKPDIQMIFKFFKTYRYGFQNPLLKGLFAKNERGYRLNAIKKRF